MLKISETETANHSISLKLEGRVAGPWADELHRVCETRLAEGWTLKLDLAEVTFVDAYGAAILSSLKTRGVVVTNCSRFVEEQLKTS